MRKEYDEDRPTVTMPGSDGTVAGTAVNEWLDDDGNPKYGDQSKGDGEAKRTTARRRNGRRTRLFMPRADAY